MNVKDACLGNNYFWRPCKNGLCASNYSIQHLNHSLIFKEVFAYLWLKIWNILHTSYARWIAYYGLHILAWEFVDAQLLSCSHPMEHTRIMLDFHVNLIGAMSFWRDRIWHLLCISSFNCYNLKFQRVIGAHPPPGYSSSPMFQDLVNKSYFYLKKCPWKYHHQHWVKCTQNNPFISLGSQRLHKHVLTSPTPLYVYGHLSIEKTSVTLC